jgi:type III pantothenate kinase
MTPDVVVDVGNSRVKWGRVADGRIADMYAYPHDDAVGWKRRTEEWAIGGGASWAVAGVHPGQVARVAEWILSHGGAVETLDSTRLANSADRTGFWVEVDEPDRVGVDRLLTAFAAWKRLPAFTPCAVVTVGTATTVDLVKPGGYFAGGAILPGPALMARSLHAYTAKLPYVDAAPDLTDYTPGQNTTTAIQLGITAAVLGSADLLAWKWSRLFANPPWIFVTGGAASYFAGFEFTANQKNVLYDRALTLDGLRLAAEALP